MKAHWRCSLLIAVSVLVFEPILLVTPSEGYMLLSEIRDATALNNCAKTARDRQGEPHLIYQKDEETVHYHNVSLEWITREYFDIWIAEMPSMICRPDGNIEIVYFTGGPNEPLGIGIRERLGRFWWTSRYIQMSLPSWFKKRYPSVIVSDNGEEHMAYDRTNIIQMESVLLYASFTGPGEAIDGPVQGMWGYEGASIVLDRWGGPHVVYTRMGPALPTIKHQKRIGDNDWGGVNTVCSDMSYYVCADQRGNKLDAVYQNAWRPGVYHSQYNCEVGSWGSEIEVASMNNPDVAFVEYGYCVWRTEWPNEIHYSWYDSQGDDWHYGGIVLNSGDKQCRWPSAYYYHPLRRQNAYLDVVYTVGNSAPFSIGWTTLDVSALPVYRLASSEDGTGPNPGSRLIRDEVGNLILAYRSGRSLKATYSWDDADSWSKPVPIGKGHVPCISLNSADEICGIWIDNEDAESEVQGKLSFTKWLGEGWSPIHELFSSEAPGFGVGPASMAIDFGDTTHVVWLARTQVGAQWADILYYGTFPTDTTYPDLTVAPIDTIAIGSPPPVPPNEGACASIAIDLLGRPNIAWEKDGEIYHTRSDIGGWTAHENMSNSAVNSSKPCMDSYGLFVHIVWEEEVASGANEVYHRRKYVSGDIWEPVENISNTPDANSGDPVICAGAHIEWSEFVGSDDDIFASDFDEESMSWSVAADISETPDTYSGYPQITFTQDEVETWVYTCWVEEDSSSYRILCDKRDPAQAPFGGFNFGQDQPNPITLNRDGIIRYGNKAHEQVDYSNSHLAYRLEHLNPAKKYKFVLTFFQDSEEQWKQEIEIDGWQIGPKSLPRGEKVTVTGWIPPKLYADGEVDISMRPVGKSKVVCSAVSVYEYDRKQGGPQFSRDSISGVVRDVRLSQIAPNPFSASTVVSYSIPERCPVSVRVFDCSGRYVQTLVDEEMPPGQHSVSWNRMDLSSGVYFVRLDALGNIGTTKATILK